MEHSIYKKSEVVKSEAELGGFDHRNFPRHIKEELDSLAGNNAPEDFVPNSISGPPPPGSDNNAIPDSVSSPTDLIAWSLVLIAY